MFVGPYQLLRPLGAGGMAEVWQARWVGPAGVAKTVALKWPRASDTAQWARHADSFAREQQVSILLTHSNIAQVFDVGVHEGRPYMAMEWVDGINLAKLVERLRARGEVLGLGEVAYVIGEILRGLAYAHTLEHEGVPLRIVHRDVSPQNVLVSVSGEIKLVDFGIARAATHDTSGDHVKGKLRYMAPEQLLGNDHGAAVDLYAVGVILHELVAGARMRDAKGEEALMAMVRGGVVPPLEGLPSELEALRLALLRPTPLDRPASARDALRLLSRWPGYRPLSSALSRRVTDVLAVSAPRSGVHPEAELDPGELGRVARQPVERARGTPEPVRVAASGEVATAREPAPQSWSGARVAGSSAPEYADPRASGPQLRGRATPRDLVAAGDAVPTVTVRASASSGRAPVTATLDETPTARVMPTKSSSQPPPRSVIVMAAMLVTAVAFVGVAVLTRASVSSQDAPSILAWSTVASRRAGEVPHPGPLVADVARADGATRGLASPIERPATEAQDESPPRAVDVEPASLAPPPSPVSSGLSAASPPTSATSEAGPEGSRPAASAASHEGEQGAVGQRMSPNAGKSGVVPTSTDSASKSSNVRPAAVAAPADVVIKAGDFEWAVLRVDRREVIVEPKASLRLGPGTHRLALRGPNEADFVTLDPIEVESGGRYELRLRSPAGYGLVRLDD